MQPKFPTTARAAFTMIELLASLALFIMIYGILLLTLNTATNLWQKPGQTNLREKRARDIISLIADDLCQAVTDNGTLPDSQDNQPEYPTFILNNPIEPTATDLQTILGFLRYSAANKYTHNLSQENSNRLLSVEGVFYLLFNNALYRAVVPLVSDFKNPYHIGELLNEAQEKARQKTANPFDDPDNNDELSLSFSCLAEQVVVELSGSFPQNLRHTPHNADQASAFSHGIVNKVTYQQLEHSILPDVVEITLYLFDEKEWQTVQNILESTTHANNNTYPELGTFARRCIVLPQSRGARLP